MPMDPALENLLAISGKPFQAFPGQDHKAHIDAHLSFMSISMVQNNPMAMGALQKNILEHISIMAQEQIQLEFVEEMKELQMIQQQLQPMMQKSTSATTNDAKSTSNADATKGSTNHFSN